MAPSRGTENKKVISYYFLIFCPPSRGHQKLATPKLLYTSNRFMHWRRGGYPSPKKITCAKCFYAKIIFRLLKIFGGARAPPGPMGMTPLYITDWKQSINRQKMWKRYRKIYSHNHNTNMQISWIFQLVTICYTEIDTFTLQCIMLLQLLLLTTFANQPSSTVTTS